MDRVVTIEIETAIRNVSWATPQVGMKSVQKIHIDFRRKQITNEFVTGETHIGPLSLPSIRDDFKVTRASFYDKSVWLSLVGETASGVYVMPNINYRFDILLYQAPKVLAITGAHDGYPSYNVAVNGESVYDYVQGYICQLAGKEDIVVHRKSIPWS